MSGSGPAIDGDDIYLATANGMDPGTKRDNFAQSLLKLRYTAGVADVNNGKPTLAVIDYWGASSGFERRDKAAPQDREAAQEQDLGSAGVVLIPAQGNLIEGRKDDILYNLNKDNLGKNIPTSTSRWSRRRRYDIVSAVQGRVIEMRGGCRGDGDRRG
jgi:hypothetical protein